MGTARHSLYRVKSEKEQQAKAALSVVDILGAINFAAWFVALSNISKKLDKFFRDNQSHFFSVSILLSLIHWALTLYKYINAPNKNIKNTTNIAYKTFNIAAYASIIAAFFIGGAVVGAMTYYLFCLVDPVYNLVKAGYYMFQMFRADSLEEKEFFYNKCQKSVKWACVLGLLTLGMLVLWVIPVLPLALTITLGAIGTLASLAMIGIAFAKKFGWIKTDKEDLKKGLIIEGDKKTIQMDDLLPEENNSANKTKWTNAFYQSIHLKKLSQEALRIRINKKIDKFEIEIKNDKESCLDVFGLFSEKDKWQDKSNALDFLKALLEAVEHRRQDLGGGKSKVSFTYPGINSFGQIEIEYMNTEDLFRQAIDRVIEDHPKAFQSWHKKCSAVLKRFHQANLMLQEQEENSVARISPKGVIREH